MNKPHYDIALARMQSRIGGGSYGPGSITLDSLNRGFSFLDDGKITFQAWLEVPHFEASELMYYPELAERLRAVPGYPTFERSYPLACKDMTGVALLQAFAQEFAQAVDRFHVEHKAENERLRGLIDRYIARREPVRVDRVGSKYLVINGITYQYQRGCYDGLPGGVLHGISFHRILDLKSEDAQLVDVAGYIPGSPFIDLRIRKTYSHSGKPNWLNLETWESVSLSEARKITRREPAPCQEAA